MGSKLVVVIVVIVMQVIALLVITKVVIKRSVEMKIVPSVLNSATLPVQVDLVSTCFIAATAA